jgi:hypothetical protein
VICIISYIYCCEDVNETYIWNIFCFYMFTIWLNRRPTPICCDVSVFLIRYVKNRFDMRKMNVYVAHRDVKLQRTRWQTIRCKSARICGSAMAADLDRTRVALSLSLGCLDNRALWYLAGSIVFCSDASAWRLMPLLIEDVRISLLVLLFIHLFIH